MTGNIYLTGFMGAGKTTVGRLLAEALNRKFVDMDDRLEAQFGRPIPAVFADLGEGAFRRKESRLLKNLAHRRRLVVATGGGVVVDEENRRLMRRSGAVVYLEADLETCLSRLTAKDLAARPLWQDLEAAGRLLKERRPCYLDCDLVLPVGDGDPDQTAQEIVTRLFPEQELTVRLDRVECPVRATFNAPAALTEFVHNRRVVVLTDQRVGRLHLMRYRPVLGDWPVVSIRGGERAKSLAVAQRLYQRLLNERIERGDLLIAIGGGVITDLGAFVAATYKRGLDFVLVATSLLGCVDAAVGGKAAINLPPAKNAVGCFTSPTGVVLDISALRTLQTKQIREGLVEAYKTGLVASPPLAELIERQRPALLARDLPALAEVVGLSAEAKAGVVSQDFRESGRRAILNLGHTYGHAVEGWHGYRVSHGQAVALGLAAAARLSRSRRLIDDALAERIEAATRLISPRTVSLPPLEEAWRIMGHDKKIRQGRMVFVLLKGLGRPVMVDDVTKEELAAALEGL